MSARQPDKLFNLTTQIVAAHSSAKHVASDELPSLIQAVYRSLASAVHPEAEPASAAQLPAVSIKKSIFPDFLICLENGKKLKMLKRHLKTTYGLSPDDYRAKWGLPCDYPMVAPDYSATRSGLAKQIGLGRKTANQVQVAEAEPTQEPKVTQLPSRRARGTKG